MGDPPAACFVQVTDLNTSRPVVAIVGRVDEAAAPQLTKGIATALATAPQDLILDLAETSFLGAAGIRIIVLARKHVRKPHQVVLRHPQPFVRKMLGICRVDTVCVVED